MQTLLEEVDGAEDLGYLLEGGYVFTPSDSGILYDTCAAVDSVIFESRSAYEMTGKFVTRFCEVILNRRVTQEDLIRVLTDADRMSLGSRNSGTAGFSFFTTLRLGSHWKFMQGTHSGSNWLS